MLEHPKNFRTGIIGFFRHMFVIASYLGVLLSLFAIHKYLLLGDGSLASHIGFSFLNGWALAKVILVGQELQIGDKYRNRKLIYVILVKSAIFAILLLVFRLIEEAVIGAVEGKNIHEAVFSEHPGLEHNTFLGLALNCLIVFFALIPFFAYLEFERVIGVSQLRALLFGDAEQNYRQENQEFTKSWGTVANEYPAMTPKGPGSENITRDQLVSASPENVLQKTSLYQDAWFYEQAGQVMGPVTETELIRLLRHGIIYPTTLVHNVTVDEDWRMFTEIFLYKSNLIPQS